MLAAGLAVFPGCLFALTGRPYWFHATSAWLAFGLLGGLLASGAWLVWLGRPETPPQMRD